MQGGSTQSGNSSNKPRPRFELDTKADASNAAVTALSSNKDDKEEGAKRRPSYMPTRGLAAVLNQGLATLGEKLCTEGPRLTRILGLGKYRVT